MTFPLNRKLFVLSAILIAAFACRVEAAAEIEPPFKLTWGESPTRLERLITGAGAKVVERKQSEDGTELWQVEGIIQEGLKRTIFSFREGALIGVELQYRSEDWTPVKYDEFMGRWRRTIEQRYGQGQLIARKTEPLGDVTQTVVGYKWNQNNTTLNLVYFSAQGPGQVFRTLSVHYKGY